MTSNLINCPHCGRPNPSDSIFCQRCGQRLSAQGSAPVAPPPQHCHQCGRPLRPQAKFCGVCGVAQQVTVAAPPPPPAPPRARPSAPAATPQPVPATPRTSSAYFVRHGAIFALLSIGLLLGLAVAFAAERGGPDIALSTPPAAPPLIIPTPVPLPTADYRRAVVEIGYGENGQFGLITRGGDPATANDDNKLLTYSHVGDTNNLRIWIDGNTPVYGSDGVDGLWGGRFTTPPRQTNGIVHSTWAISNISVEQKLAYVYGSAETEVDTMRIEYQLANSGATTRSVGLRIILDTLIGDNDGVPFVVPGHSGLIQRAIELHGAAVPDFVEALESPNLANPGVIARLTLRGADATPPDRLVISAWCGNEMEWEYFTALGGENHRLNRCGEFFGAADSALGIYFDPQPLAPGETRTLVAYYGLGKISSTESRNAQLGLSVNRRVQQGEIFWVVALIASPRAGQSVRLDLPPGLTFASGYDAEQRVVASGDFTQISWSVVAQSPLTDATLTATLLPDGITETQLLTVQATGVTR